MEETQGHPSKKQRTDDDLGGAASSPEKDAETLAVASAERVGGKSGGGQAQGGEPTDASGSGPTGGGGGGGAVSGLGGRGGSDVGGGSGRSEEEEARDPPVAPRDDLDEKVCVSIADLAAPDYDDNIDDSYLWAVVLNMKHFQDKLYPTLLKGQKSSPKRFIPGSKGSSDVSFDRMVMFGDLKSPTGACFVLVFNNPRTAQSILRDFDSNGGTIGDAVVIPEPRLEENGRCLSYSNLPIVETGEPILLGRFPIVQVPLQVPEKDGLTRWFAMHGLTIKANSVSVTESICSGTLCDRHIPPSERKVCICFQTAQQGNFVLQMAVRVFKSGELKLSQTAYRSWKTTNLFLKDLFGKEYDDFKTYKKDLRKSVNKAIEHVNENGGFSIAGWYCKGSKVDAAAKASGKVDVTEMIGSEHIQPHICRLVPSRIGLADMDELKYSLPTATLR